ncbi:unnamed protein product [Arabis nemorensis]|uniref:Uncharacterized protein n=1 Tax=Arabis nemorensis TaxID=586526 RepID=A0A565BJB5_9BRAS|nr:unnamed protein product [Arabis nemorensis]
MDQEDSCQEVKRVSSLEHIASEPDSISCLDSDSCLSEEQVGGIDISLSPLCNQYKDKMRIVDSNPCDCVLVSDEEIVESMYQNLLRIVISLQLQGNNSEICCFDRCKTPPSRLSDTGTVPDTCPGAPMKLTKVSRNIDSGLRRKLF